MNNPQKTEGICQFGERREHWAQLLIYGYCGKCLRAFTPPADEEKVFERLEVVKQIV